MKRVIGLFVFLLLALSSCSPTGTSYECSEGICIRITYEGPVHVKVPIEFTISITTDKDVADLGISLINYSNLTIQGIKNPDAAELVYDSKEIKTYLINTNGGEEYHFTGFMVLEEPAYSSRLSRYQLIATASQYSGFRVTDSFYIYLDDAGNQLEESEAKLLMETDLPLPTLPPDVTVLPDTPFPTIIWPTNTSLPTFTPTSTATPTASQTLPPYP